MKEDGRLGEWRGCGDLWETGQTDSLWMSLWEAEENTVGRLRVTAGIHEAGYGKSTGNV